MLNLENREPSALDLLRKHANMMIGYSLIPALLVTMLSCVAGLEFHLFFALAVSGIVVVCLDLYASSRWWKAEYSSMPDALVRAAIATAVFTLLLSLAVTGSGIILTVHGSWTVFWAVIHSIGILAVVGLCFGVYQCIRVGGELRDAESQGNCQKI